MKELTLLQPVLVQVALTFVLLFWMAKVRLEAIRAGTVQRGEPGTRPVWPGRAGTISNAFHNQLEMPVLFYAAVAFSMIAGVTGWEMTALAWAFSGFRIVHALIFTTYNYIPHRFMAYLASNIALIGMWVCLALTVIKGG